MGTTDGGTTGAIAGGSTPAGGTAPVTGAGTGAGAAEGWIALSLPDAMLHRLLDLIGEPQRDTIALLDLVAEMAGVITCNARAEYGEKLRVAPPFAVSAADPEPPLSRPPCAFKLPFLLIALLPPSTP